MQQGQEVVLHEVQNKGLGFIANLIGAEIIVNNFEPHPAALALNESGESMHDGAGYTPSSNGSTVSNVPANSLMNQHPGAPSSYSSAYHPVFDGDAFVDPNPSEILEPVPLVRHHQVEEDRLLDILDRLCRVLVEEGLLEAPIQPELLNPSYEARTLPYCEYEIPEPTLNPVGESQNPVEHVEPSAEDRDFVSYYTHVRFHFGERTLELLECLGSLSPEQTAVLSSNIQTHGQAGDAEEVYPAAAGAGGGLPAARETNLWRVTGARACLEESTAASDPGVAGAHQP